MMLYIAAHNIIIEGTVTTLLAIMMILQLLTPVCISLTSRSTTPMNAFWLRR